MKETVFFEIEFYALVITSFCLPVFLYIYMLRKRAISRYHVLGYGIVLVFLSVISAFFLSKLHDLSLFSLSLVDENLFASEISIALYIMPLIFAGIGINLISHVLIDHLRVAEQTFMNTESIPDTASADNRLLAKIRLNVTSASDSGVPLLSDD